MFPFERVCVTCMGYVNVKPFSCCITAEHSMEAIIQSLDSIVSGVSSTLSEALCVLPMLIQEVMILDQYTRKHTVNDINNVFEIKTIL